MLRSAKLPFQFDPSALLSDVNKVRSSEWVGHFNTRYHDGGWVGVALRSYRGSLGDLIVPPQAHKSFADTELLARCAGVQRVLEVFQCPIGAVRFLKLAPGSKIKEHRDYELTVESGQARVHVPVLTNSEVDFFLDADRMEMKPGECWYLNFSLPHWIHNRGETDRIHLVIDCEINEWLRSLLPFDRGEDLPVYTSSPREYERFRLHVLADQSLQSRLRDTADSQCFVSLILREGHKAGFRFGTEDVVAALHAARQSWQVRWID